MKMVLFGNTAPPYSVFILDVKTLVWTKGADVKPGQERFSATCTVVGDYFIIAGGANSDVTLQPVIVYNIKLDQWTDSYEAPHAPTVSTGSGNPSTTESGLPVAGPGLSSGEGMPLGAKIGIIAGGSVLIIFLTCGAFLIRRRKMRKSRQADGFDKDLPKPNLVSIGEDKYNHSNDNNDKGNNLDTVKAGDDIQLRDVLASLDHLTNRFEQQHGNQGEEAMFNGEEMDDFYEENPNHPQYSGGDMDPYPSSVLDLEYEGADYPYEYAWQQQPMALKISPSPTLDGQMRLQGARNPQNHSSKAVSPSLNGLLTPQAARNPQHHSSSIPTVAVQQWQCAEQGQGPQYIPPPSSVPSRPAHRQHYRHDPQDDHGGYHDRTDHQAFYHDQRRYDPQDDRAHHNHGTNYNAVYRDRHPNGPQASYGGPNDDEDYLAMYQDPRMNAPQEHGDPSIEKGVSFANTQRRLDPQDHTRHSTAASHLDFYQDQPFNNPQDHGNQVERDDDTLYQEIQRIRAQQEEYMLQRRNLERIHLENEAKLRILAERANYTPPRGQY
ncbi:hypothetical protein BGZ72_004963 [Mortierella alpina]|nr:hypothetical protein BGZ72_004963 [Mortierella alpina]